jgi:hypothetical protein
MSETNEPTPEQAQKYLREISAMYDEAKAKAIGFLDSFEDTSVGQLKYLFTLHLMMLEVCERKGFPPKIFHELVPSLVAIWHVMGKPAEFDFKAITSIFRKENETIN